MELPRIVSAVRRYILGLVILALVGGVVGAGIELSKPSAYVASIRMFANQGAANSTPVSQSPSLAVARMGTFVRLADSTALAERLVTELGLPDSPKSLSSRITASLDRDTVIMQVTVSAPTEDQARRIAEAVPDQYTDLVNSLSGLRSSSENATILTVFDGPRVAPTRSLRRLVASAALGMAIAGSLGLAGALARERRRSARSPEVLVSVTGLPVVGIVPRADADEDGGWVGPVDEEQRLSCHRLARNLPLLLDGSGRLVVVTTPRNSEESLEVSIGLAGALTQRGDRVLLLDAGHGGQGVGQALGLDDEPEKARVPKPRGPRGSTKAAAGKPPAGKAATEHAPAPFTNGPGGLVTREVEALPGLALATVGGGLTEPASGRPRHALADAITAARPEYDVVVVNSAPVLSRSVVPTAIEDADAVLLVIDQFETPLEDCAAATAGVRAMSRAGVGLVVHRADEKSMPSAQFLSGVVATGSASAP